MVAALLVLRLVVNHGTLDFHLTGIEIALEIRAVILRIPKAPFHKRKQLNIPLNRPSIFHSNFMDLPIVILRHKKSHINLNPFSSTPDLCVTHPMAALIKIKRPLCRDKTRRPKIPLIIQVKIAPPTHIKRDIIIAETRDTAQLCVLKKTVPARCIRNQRKKILCAKIINPWVRGQWCRNHILLILIIKIAEFHAVIPLLQNIPLFLKRFRAS